MNLTDESQAILQRRIDIGRAAMAGTRDEGDLETAATDAISDILTAVVGPYGYAVAGQLRPDPTSFAEAWTLIDRAISSWVGDAEDYYVAPISDERAAARKRLEEPQAVNDAAEADTIGDWW